MDYAAYFTIDRILFLKTYLNYKREVSVHLKFIDIFGHSIAVMKSYKISSFSIAFFFLI